MTPKFPIAHARPQIRNNRIHFVSGTTLVDIHDAVVAAADKAGYGERLQTELAEYAKFDELERTDMLQAESVFDLTDISEDAKYKQYESFLESSASNGREAYSRYEDIIQTLIWAGIFKISFVRCTR